MKEAVVEKGVAPELKGEILRTIGNENLTAREIFLRMVSTGTIPAFSTIADIRGALAELRKEGQFKEETYTLTDDAKSLLADGSDRLDKDKTDQAVSLSDNSVNSNPESGLGRPIRRSPTPARVEIGSTGNTLKRPEKKVGSNATKGSSTDKKFDHQIEDATGEMIKKGKDAMFLFVESGKRVFLLSDGRVMTRFASGKTKIDSISNAVMEYGTKMLSVNVQIATHRLSKS